MQSIGALLSKRLFDHPVFVIGSGRSGTSVLVQALGKHPNVTATQKEAVFLTSIAAATSDIAEERDTNVDFFDGTLAMPYEQLLHGLRRLCFESAFGEHYAWRHMLQLLARGRLDKIRKWCVKTFPSLDVAEGLLTLYPSAKFVYILRNGCDVVQSRTKFDGFRRDTFDAHCREWSRAIHSFAFAMHHEKVLVVRQEQMVQAPDTVLQSIFDHIEVPHDAAPVTFVKTTLVHPLDAPDATGVDVKAALATRSAAYASWTAEQKQLFREVCGDAMRLAGYEIPF